LIYNRLSPRYVTVHIASLQPQLSSAAICQ